ncbi:MULTISPECIES: acyl carrier protein [Myxococcus]|uniref:acyl carrier protein n=1 Tax=Myxococcus TaxID=32 RepID=UPI0013D21B77|nr:MULTISPECIES: acyl carrier protein [Myxococcus]NVJ22763.1 acyl carrier protein [Myxococcus sp. AM011]
MKTSRVTETLLISLHALGHAPGSVSLITHLQDELGIDSIETVELAATVCGRLGLPPHLAPDVRNVHTVAELAARIEPLLARDSHLAVAAGSP